MKKFNFEGTCNFFSDEPHIFLPSAFKMTDKEIYSLFENHNIYIITRTNRVWFHPDLIKLDKSNGVSTFHFVIQNKYHRTVHPIVSRIPNNTEYIQVSDFPHTEIFLKNINGEVINSINAMEFLMELPEEAKPDFEVLYIGKSYGRNQKINILDRLFKQYHRKFNDILIETMENEPDKQVVIMALNFTLEKRIIGTNFRKSVNTSSEEEYKRIQYLKNIKTEREHKIDIIEEALINYFEPKYNGILKNSLGKLSSKAVKVFRELDLSGIVVEFNTKISKVKLKSDCVPPKKLHIIQFSTFKDKDRATFIDLKNLKKSRQENTDFLLDFL